VLRAFLGSADIYVCSWAITGYGVNYDECKRSRK
jgi:hypothetical protein